MSRAFILFIGGFLTLGSCTQRSICPAFQSAYIYDQDVLRKKFSYFQEDSTPKIFAASKNKYLIAEPTPYRKKVRSLQTVQMKPVPVQVPDSLLNKDSVSMSALDLAARSVIDSTFIGTGSQPRASAEDSVYVITKDKELRLLKYNSADSLVYDPVLEKYVAQKPEYYVKNVRLNIEQDNYMWYLRDYLVLPDVRLAKLQQGGEKGKELQKNGVKKEKKGFFKNLFKKKPKTTDSTNVVPPPKDEFDFINADTLTQVNPPTTVPETKKGFFSPRKKKSKDKDTNNAALVPNTETEKPKPAEPAKKEEGLLEGF